MASLQEDPAEDSLCLACFYRATTVQGLELDLRFCDGKLNCYYCCTASPYLPLDPLLRPERPRSSKKGRRNLRSKRAAIWFFSVPLPHIEALPLSALSVPVCLSGLLSFGRSLSRNTVRNDLCRAHLAHQAGLA